MENEEITDLCLKNEEISSFDASTLNLNNFVILNEDGSYANPKDEFLCSNSKQNTEISLPTLSMVL